MVITDNHTQPFGILHGGVSLLIAEGCASAGCYLNVNPQTHTVVGLELNANHISPGIVGDTIIATGHPIHIGRRNQVWEVVIKSKQTGRLISIVRGSCAVIPIEEMQSKKDTLLDSSARAPAPLSTYATEKAAAKEKKCEAEGEPAPKITAKL